MRIFKTRRRRVLPFRLFLIFAGALMLLAAFAPSAKANSVIAYFNFEDATAADTPPDYTSESDQGLGVTTTMTTNYGAFPQQRTAQPIMPVTLGQPVEGDADTARFSLGLARTNPNNGAHFDIPLNSAQGIFQDMTMSFAISNAGNGFTTAYMQYSIDGGLNFTTFFTSASIAPNMLTLLSAAVPAAANNHSQFELRIVLTGGTSNGNNLETVIDNVLVRGTIVPEPATVAGGLFGVLGLCFHQRRRLRSLLPRSRRT